MVTGWEGKCRYELMVSRSELVNIIILSSILDSGGGRQDAGPRADWSGAGGPHWQPETWGQVHPLNGLGVFPIVITWKMCWDYQVFWKLVAKPFLDNKWDLQKVEILFLNQILSSSGLSSSLLGRAIEPLHFIEVTFKMLGWTWLTWKIVSFN